jgi:SAM-dependent methyltransferase
MTQVQRNAAYFATQVDTTELERLAHPARLRDPHVRDGLLRVGLAPGATVIDIGCGPLGALLVLADLVGPTGTVVGLDMDAPSLQHARTILDQHGHRQVHLVHANLTTMSPTAVCPPGPFDVAVCSQFLNNQPNPIDTLRRIASCVRSGGHLVVQSSLVFAPVPPSEPAVPGLARGMAWWGELMRRRGATPEVAMRYHAVCQAAGLIEVSQRGFFLVETAEAGAHLRMLSEALVGFRAALVQEGIAAAADVDDVLHHLQEAATWEFQMYCSGLHVELIAQVP